MSETKQHESTTHPASHEAKPHEAKTVKHAGPKTPAAESGHPEVHQLLAQRQTAVMNREALQPTDPEAVKALHDAMKAADEEIAAVDAQLAELGYC